jgi:hypothetical protein
MGYIIKDTQGLVVTRLTDVGRRKISQGNFNISYFQVGDSEINYTAIEDYNIGDYNILEPAFNAQNNVGVPQSTKNNIKYPFYLQNNSNVAYGIPFQASAVYEVYQTASPAGPFITGSSTPNCYYPSPTNLYVVNSQYIADTISFNGGNTISISIDACPNAATDTPSPGDYVVIYMLPFSDDMCDCFDLAHPILTYKVVSFGGGSVTLDRAVPNLNALGFSGIARLFFYPSSMLGYDLPTPQNYWNNSVINFQSVCVPESGFVTVWNMNIPWSETPAGLTTFNGTYQDFASRDYLGTKEYYGYQSSLGQIDTSGTSYYNSFGNEVILAPEDQKAIAIVHYTNNTIVNFFGEKFATEAYDPDNDGATGQARNFRVVIPGLMWHKSTSLGDAEIFYIDPPGFDGLDLLTPYYIQSTQNSDMNNPGIRYFHLYDIWPNSNGRPSRVGKVFPDDKIIIFDDEEIVAALSYVTNRNFTLPAPQLDIIIPGTCGGDPEGILDDNTQCLWVTYGFAGDWTGMHCNYYQKICGISGATQTQVNVVVSFGSYFTNMTQDGITGFNADEFFVLAQLTNSDVLRPDPTQWRRIDFTSQLTGSGYIDPADIVSSTFIVSQTNYDSAPLYDINDYIEVPAPDDETSVTFGGEYLFNGEIQTDIEATIYEMRYLVNLPNNQFVRSTNPTWNSEISPYMSEVGLYDADKNLMVLAKFQSPQIREGIQQVVVKLDF